MRSASLSLRSAAVALGDLAGELLAVGADQAGDVVAVGRDAVLLERAQPRLDARLDGVNERAVEIEDQSARRGKRVEAGQRRFR